MVNIGLVGLGWWGRRMAKQIIKARNTCLYTCFARNEKTRQEFAQEFGCSASGSFETILKDPHVDALILETPNNAHKDQILAAVHHKKHVLVDKPLTGHLEEAVFVYRETLRSNLVVTVGHNSRRRPEVRFIKKILEEEELGKPVLIEANLSSGLGLRLKPNEWRWSDEKCFGGPLPQLAIHHIDTFRYLLGTIKTVFSIQKKRYAPAQIVDNVICLFEFEEGHLGYIGSSYCSRTTYSLSIYMTKGRIHYDDDFGLAVMNKDKFERKVYQSDISIDDSLLDEIEEFTCCIEKGVAPEVSVKDGLMAVATIRAALEANRTSKKVYVQDLLQEYGISCLD